VPRCVSRTSVAAPVEPRRNPLRFCATLASATESVVTISVGKPGADVVAADVSRTSI